MKNYLNRIAALTLALMLSVSVPFAVGAEEATEDANVQAENIILPEVEEPAAAAEEPAIEVPAVVASVRISCQNLGSCEYFGDRLFLKADIKNGDGSESVSWQVNENYASGSGNWAHAGNGATLSVTITPAIAQYGYRCVLSTGAMSSVFVVDKSFSERPVEPATVEAEPVAEEKAPETAAPAEPVKEEPAQVEEVKTEEKVEEVKTEEKVDEVKTEENVEEVKTEEKVEEEQPAVEAIDVIETEIETESNNDDKVLPEEEIEFDDEEVLEFDDDDWGTTESDLFTAFDDLANSYVEESEETAADNTMNEELPEENIEEIIRDDNTNEELDENNTDEVTSENITSDEIEEEITDKITEENTADEETSEETIDEETPEETTNEENQEENIDEEILEESTDEVALEVNTDDVTEEENVNEEICDEDIADTEITEIISEENTEEENVVVEDEPVDPMELINADRFVTVSFQWESEDHVFGNKVLARAILTGYDNTVYELQWQHSKDGVNYTDIAGATGETFEFVVTEDNYMDYWQVKVVIVAVVNE